MKKYDALSIMYPAIENILAGTKKVEIRSWLPPTIPFLNLVLVENSKYLNDGDEDSNGHAKAIVDIISYREWTYEEFLMQPDSVKLGRPWKEGYYVWVLDNIRKIDKKKQCLARNGIYPLEIEI
ncbi:hypothetical protein GQQ23_12780 [Pantoea agglomerans]|jgi:hypothetical protein|uniref:hypothetical protein n=1 Tax=Enterobacter agglomerans TaxID=549 RepID=UPI00026D2204|nr:hypothetical protein [Pantoea agglomerans]NEG63205.1 hypothetical protein [Pantoea agglomerans]